MNLNWAPELVNGGTEDPNFASLDSVVSISLRFSRSTTAEHTTCEYDSGTDTLLYPSISTTWSTIAWPHTCSGGRPAITGVQRHGQCVNVTDAWTPRSVSYDRTVRVCQTTDDARTISRSHTYDASRNNQHSFAATATAYRFTGKERDTESGNDYFDARYYASNMGRFMSPDPGPYIWNDPQTLNRYAYTRNNPLKFIDPNGQYFVIASGNEQARQAISMLLRSNTGRALVGSIAADPRPTYVTQGRIKSDKGLATPGVNQSIYANANGQGVLGGTTITIDFVNAYLGANGNPLYWMILKAYAHELSHSADKNAAPNWGAADDAGKAGDRLPNGDPCHGGVTTCGSAEALALKILAELGDPTGYTPDAGADAEAGGIIDQGNRQENGDPPFTLNPNSSSGRQRPNGKFCPAEYSVCN